MSKHFFLIFLLALSFSGYAQVKKVLANTIGISIPVIWNNSEATFYRLGSPMYPSGQAISYGININYSRTLYRNFYGIAGIGYFNQMFGLKRPFNYDSLIQFGWSTEFYKYDNAQLYLGFGYKLFVSKTSYLNGDITYNHYYSYRQKYINNSPIGSQINHENITIGRTLNFNIGLGRNITERISLGVGAILPIYTHWHNDEMFIKYEYADDTQQIGRNKFSFGLNISFSYHF